MKEGTKRKSGVGSKKRGRASAWLLAILGCLLLAAALIYAGNRLPGISAISISSERIPRSFDGFKIAQISDLHSTEFGAENSRLTDMLRESEPDIIVFTGDLIDYTGGDAEVGIDLVREAAKLAPVYFITGNHEAARNDFDQYAPLELRIISAGAVALRNESVQLERGGEHITLAGVDDPGFMVSKDLTVLNANIDGAIASAVGSGENYTVLLSHRAEMLGKYADAGVDLALCGHAHGGLIRLPFIGGLYSPGQGLFPKYDSGLYSQGDTDMVVSRGLGNSRRLFRINNPPELVIVELKSSMLP